MEYSDKPTYKDSITPILKNELLNARLSFMIIRTSVMGVSVCHTAQNEAEKALKRIDQVLMASMPSIFMQTKDDE